MSVGRAAPPGRGMSNRHAVFIQIALQGLELKIRELLEFPLFGTPTIDYPD